MVETMLTTVDNPYNPFTQYDDWMAFDHQKGYYTNEYLARIANTSMDLPDSVNFEIINDAINEIISFDVLGIYQKVTKDTFASMKAKPFSEENKESLKLLEGSKGLETSEDTIEEAESKEQSSDNGMQDETTKEEVD